MQIDNQIVEAKSFIKNELNSFVLDFPQTKVRYEFDIDAKVHCVEIVPNSIYQSDSDYISWENTLTDEFISLFPNQNICFFSDDAIVGIKNVEFEILGKKYFDFTSNRTFKNQISIDNIILVINNTKENIQNFSTSIAVSKPDHKIIFDEYDLMTGSFNGLINNQNENTVSINKDYLMAS